MIDLVENSALETKDTPKPGAEKKAGTTEIEAEPDPNCQKVFFGLKQLCRSSWSVEFAKRFGPG
jgi:hypothetical protein